MLEDNVKALIAEKARDLNNMSYVADNVSYIIRRLNYFIDQHIDLEDTEINVCLDQLIGFFTTTLHIPLNSGLKLLRARSFDDRHLESEIQELSYISKAKSHHSGLGRLNLSNVPIYYGCIYFNDASGGVNVAFSEIDAKPTQTINILYSEVTEELHVYFIGIYNYIFREMRPYFISENIFDYFREVYDYQKDTYSEDVFLAHQLCDAFFSDILRRAECGNLYKVSSKLSKLFLEDSNIDGVIYTSVKAEGSPVVAIKTTSVDSKLLHKKAESFVVENDFGYAFYRAKHYDTGKINGTGIEWQLYSKA